MLSLRLHKGFTVIEIIMVIGLMSIIISFGAVFSLQTITKSNVTQERDLFVALLLNRARAQALAHVHATAHGVYVNNETHEYVLFEGTTYILGATTNRTIPFTSEHIVVRNEHTDPTYSIIFAPLSGNIIEGDGIITITNTTASHILTLRKTGQIDW